MGGTILALGSKVTCSQVEQGGIWQMVTGAFGLEDWWTWPVTARKPHGRHKVQTLFGFDKTALHRTLPLDQAMTFHHRKTHKNDESQERAIHDWMCSGCCSIYFAQDMSTDLASRPDHLQLRN